MEESLRGRTIALAEGRQLEELAQMLEKEGATALRYPMINILDAPDAAPVIDWLRKLIQNQFDYVILMTGEALRRLLGFAEREGIREEVIAAIARTQTITRGPKPVRALKEIGLSPSLIADPPTTEGVIATLKNQRLQGKRVGLTLYGEPNPTLVKFLEQSGAKAYLALSYVYAPASDADRVVELISRLAGGGIDVIIFTSSPQVEHLFQVAREKGLDKKLQNGLARAQVAAVGPVVADTLHERGVKVDICPDQGFVMKNLVQQIKRHQDQSPLRQQGQ
jgi:uroporphyrinogen-III synthase